MAYYSLNVFWKYIYIKGIIFPFIPDIHHIFKTHKEVYHSSYEINQQNKAPFKFKLKVYTIHLVYSCPTK